MDLSTLNELVSPNGTLYIAFSGGADSMCLAHRLANDPVIAEHTKKICLHIDHGLDERSSERAHRACHLADALHLPCIVKTLHLNAQRNIEASARNARYAFFKATLQSGDVLVTAHHKDDVAETLILRMLRGAGIAGLSGIEVDQPFGQGRLIRPLLDWSRAEIVDYLNAHQLDWIDDPTNELTSIDRNYIRHEIMPRLLERFPGAPEALNRSASLNRQASILLNETITKAVTTDERDHQRLCITDWVEKTPFQKAEMIRMWCLKNDMHPPPGKPLESFVAQIRNPRTDCLPTLQWDGYVIYCYRRHLWLRQRLADASEHPATYDIAWDHQHAMELPLGLGTLRLDAAKLSQADCLQALKQPTFRVTSRQADEQIQWGQPARLHRTKNLLAGAHIPPWERDLWPRVWLGKRLVACGARWQSPELNNALIWETSFFGTQPN